MIDVDRPGRPGPGQAHARATVLRLPLPRLPLLLLPLLLAAPAAHGGGFALFDQGAKAMALAGAFTAQADDGSAVFYNAGGLALLEVASMSGGGVVQGLGDAQVQGLPPGLAAGGTGEEATLLEVPGVHAYWVQPLRPRLVFGVGLDTPFYLSTDWDRPDDFPGRTLNLDSELRALDVNPAVAVRIGRSLGLGFGVVLRASEITHERRLQRVEPLSQELVDVASFDLETDVETGFGWNVGVLQQVSPYFAWGVAYRSGVDVDYAGSGTLTQIPSGNDQFDELLADTLPFDQALALATSLEFPAIAGAGVAFGFGTNTILELDAGWTEWSRVQQIPFVLPNDPGLSSNVELRFDDAMSARLGLLVQTASGAQWRAGLAFEESPQPDETVGPFFADADATVLAFGFGKDWLDVAVSWTQYADRTVTGNVDGFNGNWSADALRLGITVRNVFGEPGKPKLPKAPEAPKLPTLPGG
jgi:long-chain fatty acid transport protein